MNKIFRRIICLTAVFAIVCTMDAFLQPVLASHVYRAPRANLVLNPSFDGNLDDWYLEEGDSLVYNASLSFDAIGGSAQLGSPGDWAVLGQLYSYSMSIHYARARFMVNEFLGETGSVGLYLEGPTEVDNIANPTPNVWYTLNGSLACGVINDAIYIAAFGTAGDFLLWVDLVEMDTAPLPVVEFEPTVFLLVCTVTLIGILSLARKKKRMPCGR